MQFVDLKGQYNKIKPEVDAAIAEVLAGTAFIKGPQVALFEENLSRFTGAKHVIGCANGTDALQIALIDGRIPRIVILLRVLVDSTICPILLLRSLFRIVTIGFFENAEKIVSSIEVDVTVLLGFANDILEFHNNSHPFLSNVRLVCD